MKLSEYAKDNCITYRAAWNRFKLGKIPNAYKDGRILIGPKKRDDKKVAIYARVSSNENKSNLDSQAKRL